MAKIYLNEFCRYNIDFEKCWLLKRKKYLGLTKIDDS